MQKIIVDTNVLVSALIQRSFPYLIVRHCIFNRVVQLCCSKEIIAEYTTVLRRPKFMKYPDFATKTNGLLQDIESRSSMFEPKNTVKLLRDENDNRFLELAQASNAGFLITGNPGFAALFEGMPSAGFFRLKTLKSLTTLKSSGGKPEKNIAPPAGKCRCSPPCPLREASSPRCSSGEAGRARQAQR